MHVLYVVLAIAAGVMLYIFYPSNSVSDYKSKQSNAIVTKNTEAQISENKKDVFRQNVRTILSKAFFMQKDQSSAKEVMRGCVQEILDLINAEPDIASDYVLAYRTLASFLENLSEPEVYKKYVEMIDTQSEINGICDALSWLASAMSGSRNSGFDIESIKAASKTSKIFSYMRLIVHHNIFTHLCKRQRDFVMPIVDICENSLNASMINNEPGPEDGADLYTNMMYITFSDAKEVHKQIQHLREFAENIADRIEHDTDTVLASNIEKLNEYMKNVYMMNIVINNNLIIKPTMSIVNEIVALCDNTVNKIKLEQERRKQLI